MAKAKKRRKSVQKHKRQSRIRSSEMMAPLLDPGNIPRVSCIISDPPPPPPGLPRGEPPSRLLSDSLTRLIEPYISWPPRESELDQFLNDLYFGADVWNATLMNSTDHMGLHRELIRIVSVHFDPKDRSGALAMAKKISGRKKKLFGDDVRLIVDVRLEHEGEQPIVYAIGTSWS